MQKDGVHKSVSNVVLTVILPGVIGLSFGGLAASGVLTVLMAVGLMPRYAGRVHEAKHITLFENIIIWGTMSGTFVSLFGGFVSDSGLGLLGTVTEMIYGVFSGIFVGSLALAIAEMLDAFPIFFRRLRLSGGLTWIVLSIALGKMTGGFVYFYFKLYETVSG